MRLSTAMIVVILLACACRCSAADASVRDAVVRVGNCSGVCVSPSGLIVTAKHCRIPQTTSVHFSSRRVTARRVWVAPQMEGPVILDAEGEGYAFAPISAAPPRAGERVFSMGFRTGNFSRMEGTLTGRTRTSTGVTMAVTDFRVFRGNSGGPLFNARGEVIGLASMTTMDRGPFGWYREQPHRSYWITWRAVKTAVLAALPKSTDRSEKIAVPGRPQSADPAKPVLYVFTSPGCSACDEFKRDVAAGYFNDFDIRLLEAGSPRFRAAYERMRRRVSRPPRRFRVPAFWIAESTRVRIGYARSERLGLVNWLLETLRHHLAPSVLWERPDAPQPESSPGEPQTELGEPEKFERSPMAELEEFAAQVKQVREALRRVQSEQAGVVEKIRTVLALKSEVPELRQRLGDLKQRVEHPRQYIDWWWGLFAALAGMAKRRWLNER